MKDDTQPGVLGRYRGFDAGSTPADDADLHSSGNPFGAGGAPPIDVSRSSEFPPPNPALGTPYGYFTNPPTTDTHNPHALGSGGEARPAGETALTNDVASGLAADYGHVLGNMAGGTSPQASADPASVYQDEGYSRSGEGRS